MTRKRTNTTDRRRRPGFTLIEVLLSLTLLTLLVGAIAAGTHASLTSYDENTKIAALNQTTRVLLGRIRREVRTAEAVDHQASPGNLVISPPASTGINQIRYEFNYENQALYYHQTIGTETTTQTILDSSSPVRMVSFSPSYETVVIDEVTCTKRVVISIYFQTDEQIHSIVCSAAPRRNQQY